MAERRRSTFGTMPWWALALVGAAIVGIFLVSFIGGSRKASPDGEAFGGTDSAATAAVEERGTKPWFEPVFEPGSGEVESGLFALQAALGAGVVGYVGGRFHERRIARRRQDATGSGAQRAAGGSAQPAVPSAPGSVPDPADAHPDPGA